MKMYKRHRFPPKSISQAAWLYYRIDLLIGKLHTSPREWRSPGIIRQCIPRTLIGLDSRLLHTLEQR